MKRTYRYLARHETRLLRFMLEQATRKGAPTGEGQRA